MAKLAHSGVYMATTSGSWADPRTGQEYSFTKDVTRVRSGHPLVEGCPEFFAPAEDKLTYDVEQATAAPGEVRA